MISQQGRVVATIGDDVVVKVGGLSGCPACDAGEGCGAGIFGRLLRNRNVDVTVHNRIGATMGQNVNLGIEENQFLALVFRLYVWPLIAGLAGVAAGFAIAWKVGADGFVPDLAGLIVGLLTAGLALIHSRRKLREFTFASKVHLLQAVSENEQSVCTFDTNGSKTSIVNEQPYEER